MVQAKQPIRKQIKMLREQLSDTERTAYNEAITARLMLMPDYQQADTVLGYMNFGAEFASERWVAQALSGGKRVALPRVNHHTNHLDLYWVEDMEGQLAQGLWGIREPIVERCERLAGLNEVEFALLPGIAFTLDGARLGYGGGFYDKLLGNREARPVLAAAAYSLQLVEKIPQETTDVTMDWIITEQETVSCCGLE